MSRTASSVLALEQIHKDFVQGPKTLHVLRGIDLTVTKGELVALVGSSGSGKSTLLQIAGLLDHPTSGTVAIAGKDTAGLKEDDRAAIRRQELGFVYQFHHLLPDFTARENVELAARIAGESPSAATEAAMDVLSAMGLSDRTHHTPAELSGGEQQRVAIARALVAKPDLLLADEPTGNLDEDTAQRVFDLFVSIVRDRGLAAVIATHDKSLAAKMDRQISLSSGQLVEA